MNGPIDRIAHRGKPHLSNHQQNVALCGKTAPFWYRVVPWDGTSKGVCKNCIKAVTKQALAEQAAKVSMR